MYIKWLLERKKECLRYPKTYSSEQMESAEEILKIFGNIILSNAIIEVRLEDKNTVIVMPVKGHKLGGGFLRSDIPDTHKVQWNKNSLTIKPKKKFEKEFPQTLIIQRFYC